LLEEQRGRVREVEDNRYTMMERAEAAEGRADEVKAWAAEAEGYL